MTDTALIAGTGALPALLAAERPDMLVCELEGFPSGLPDALRFRVERLVPFVEALVPRVDLGAGTLTLADVGGLIDDDAEEAR